MTAQERKEREEQWLAEMIRSIRDAFVYGDIGREEGLFITMNGDTYGVLSRLMASSVDRAIYFGSSIYGMPIRLDREVPTGQVRISVTKIVYEFIPTPYLMEGLSYE